MSVTEGQLLWQPSEDFANNSNITHYINWLKTNNIADCDNYHELWQWSVDHIETYWASLWDYFDILTDTPYEKVTDSLEMKPGNRWFIGSRVNWAEHILRHERPGEAALYSLSETRPLTSMNWDDLAGKVRILAGINSTLSVCPTIIHCGCCFPLVLPGFQRPLSTVMWVR
jgi:acetoacetyl-CoA synthetase